MRARSLFSEVFFRGPLPLSLLRSVHKRAERVWVRALVGEEELPTFPGLKSWHFRDPSLGDEGRASVDVDGEEAEGSSFLSDDGAKVWVDALARGAPLRSELEDGDSLHFSQLGGSVLVAEGGRVFSCLNLSRHGERMGEKKEGRK